MSKVRLQDIQTLYLFQDAETKARRSSPIPQLTCEGKLCKKFQPSSVTCSNIGGSGQDVVWKCEADLPSSLRFGKIDVSCEGWRSPSDQYILEGSCGLTYNLVKIDSGLEDDTPRFKANSNKIGDFLFGALYVGIFLAILYYFIKSCTSGTNERRIIRPSAGGPSTGGTAPGGYPSSGGGTDAPPPYAFTKPADASSSTGWTPGFWTGLGLGTAGTYLWGNGGRRRTPPPRAAASSWDWDRPFTGSQMGSGFTTRFPSSSEGSWSSRAPPSRNDRGEGTSDLGTMRSSSGLARSSIR